MPGWGMAAPLLAAAAPALMAGSVTVQVHLPEEPRLDTEGLNRILVGSFLTDGSAPFDIAQEMTRLVRSVLIRNSQFEILEDPPVNLPEQRLEDLKQNAMFFQTVAQEHAADLLISGRIAFLKEDRSGFIQEEYISPLSGRRSIRTRFVERSGYILKADFIFLRGTDGQLLYDTSLQHEETVDEEVAEPMSLFFTLAARMRERFLAVLLPQVRTETRYLLTP
jgi:hypothetical protein